MTQTTSKTINDYSTAEAAYITKLSVKQVHKAIDEEALTDSLPAAWPGRRQRKIKKTDLIYLQLMKEVSSVLQKPAKQALYKQLSIMTNRATVITLGPVSVKVAEARKAVTMRIKKLERANRLVISDPEIRGGEPVVKGTRIPVYLLADLVKQGASETEILEDYPSLDQEKLEAALAYSAAYPRRGRPKRRPWQDAR